MKTVAEQIAAFQAKLQQSKEAAAAIVAKSIEEGRTLDAAEIEQRNTHLAEAKSVEDHLAVLRDHEKSLVTKAEPVERTTGQQAAVSAGVDVGAARNISVRPNMEKGMGFHRLAVAMARAKGNVMLAHEIAKSAFGDTPQVAEMLKASIMLGGTRELHETASALRLQKAAVPFATTTDTSFVGPLVQYETYEQEFIELLRPATVIGKLDRLRRVPFMSRIGRQLTGVLGSFVGEGQPKPLGKQTYDAPVLGFAKAAIIVVLSDESVRFSTPNAETLARQDMINGIAEYLDKRFLDPAYSGTANVSPASITNGATRVQATGSTLAAADAAAKAAMAAAFAGTNISPATAVWVMPATAALGLSMLRNSQGDLAFPQLTMNGGTWYGLPVIVSNAMVASGSPGELQIALVTQSEVLMADDGGVSIDMSNEASVQLSDSPSAGAQSLVSLWQNNLVGLRAERYINWAAARPGNAGIVLIENTNF